MVAHHMHLMYCCLTGEHQYSGVTVYIGAALKSAELRKHIANDAKSNELLWVCIPFGNRSFLKFMMED